MTSTIGSTYTPDIQRYIVQTSDVLSDHRLTVSPLADPSTVIWYTERYLSQQASGPPEIVENIVHQPTNTVCWSVHRPTNIRQQGWYVRLRSPMFPPGVSIPIQPVSSTSPYYVDGALSFKCRTNDLSKLPPPPPPLLRNASKPRGSADRSSVSSTSSGGSSNSKHSYPPTPTGSPPPTSRRGLPPLRVPSSIASKGRVLTGEAEDVYVIGTDDHEEDQTDSKTPTTTTTFATAIRPPSVIANGSTNAPNDFKRPLSLSNGKGKETPPISTLRPNSLQPQRHPAPPNIPFSHINEFILVPLSETANASSGPFVNLSSTPSSLPPSSSSPRPHSVAFPHSHHRTSSNAYNPNVAVNTIPSENTGQNGILGKAMNLLKSSLPTTLSNTLNSTMQGNSFTITLVPDLSGAHAGMPTINGGSKLRNVVSPPPPYTSTVNLLGGSTANLNEAGPSTGYFTPSTNTASAISSSSFVQPLPPPLLSFTDETSMFPVTFGFGGLFKRSGPIPPPASNHSHSRISLQPSPRHVNQPSPPVHASSSSLPFISLTSPASVGPESPSNAPSRSPINNPNYTTLGTLTVSKSQLAHLGVDTAFWITCALVFWGYLEEKEGYLSAIDD